MQPKVALVILHWNKKELLDISLPSVFDLDYDNYHVYLVDNGSTDDSKQYIEKKYKDHPKVTYIDKEKNYGFAEGNNIALKEAFKDPDLKYIAPLNNDTKVEPNYLKAMVEIMEADETVGSVAPKIKFYYEDNLIDTCGIVTSPDGGGMNRGFKEKDEGQYEKQEEVFGPCAGAALYRAKAFKEVDLDVNNYFDRNFFAYYEDLDLAWRLQLLGYKSIYTPKTTVLHVHSATGVSHSPFKAFHVQRNRLITLVHNFPLGLMLYGLFILTAWRYLHLLNSALFKKSGPSHELKQKTSMKTLIWITIKAWFSFIWMLPRILKNRWKIQRSKKLSRKQVKELFTKYSVSLNKMIYL